MAITKDEFVVGAQELLNIGQVRVWPEASRPARDEVQDGSGPGHVELR